MVSLSAFIYSYYLFSIFFSLAYSNKNRFYFTLLFFSVTDYVANKLLSRHVYFSEFTNVHYHWGLLEEEQAYTHENEAGRQADRQCQII